MKGKKEKKEKKDKDTKIKMSVTNIPQSKKPKLHPEKTVVNVSKNSENLTAKKYKNETK